MKPNLLATLVLRLMGIYCLIQSLPMLGMLGSLVIFAKASGGVSQSVALIVSILPGIIMLAVGVLLLIFSTRLGRMLVPEATSDSAAVAITFEQAQVLAFAVAGILILADSLPKLPHGLSTLISWAMARKEDRQFQGVYGQFGFFTLTSAAGTVLQAGLGLALFFRARGFANFWRSLRSFATPKPPQD